MRIWIASPSGGMSEVLTTASPVEAEAHYLRLARLRTPEPASLTIDPMRNPLVLPARYRLDMDWHADAPREQVVERWRQLWAPADQWVGPTPEQLRAVVEASGMSGAAIAKRLGVGTRIWRRWASDPTADRTHVPIGYATWVAALRLTGLLPDDEHEGPVVRYVRTMDPATAQLLRESDALDRALGVPDVPDPEDAVGE